MGNDNIHTGYNNYIIIFFVITICDTNTSDLSQTVYNMSVCIQLSDFGWFSIEYQGYGFYLHTEV